MSLEAETLLIRCMNETELMHSLDLGEKDSDILCRIIRAVAYRGSKDACLYLIAHRESIPPYYHSLISSAAERHFTREEIENGQYSGEYSDLEEMK